MKVCNGSDGEFIYFGIRDQLIKQIDVRLHETNDLEIMINIDGMSPFKSSAATIWPILCKVYTKLDLYEPFIAAVYSGNGKPKYVTEYLSKFVRELNDLLMNGLIIISVLFSLKVKFFSCDSPARSFIKGSVSHMAFHGCERCNGLGQRMDSVTVFLNIDAEKRTEEDFRTFTDPDHHNDVSPLCAVQPTLNLISQFILDPMHLLYLGCTKRLLEYLLSSSTRKVRLSSSLKTELTRRTTMINGDIPLEFPRKMRSSDHFAKFKAVEFKFFLLYAAPVVLKKLLSEDLYNHFMLLTVACRLLSTENKNLHIVDARNYLRKFVKDASTLYGSTFVSLNVHNLIHLPDDVENTRCSLSELSAFAFESYLGSISATLRSPKHLLAQYCRRLQEKQTFAKKVVSVPPQLEVLGYKKKKVFKIKYKGMILSSAHPNNTVLLRDKSVAEICQFNCTEDVVSIEVKKYLKKESLFHHPCDSSTLNIWQNQSTCVLSLYCTNRAFQNSLFYNIFLISMTDSESEGEIKIKTKKLKKFSLVQFIHRGPKRKVESIDIVPSKWLAFENNRCVTKYMRPLYEGESLTLLNNLIKINADAPDDWPTYSVAIKGEAKDYTEALRKIDDLAVQEHVWSLDSEESATEMQKEVMNGVKRAKLLSESQKMMSKFSSPAEEKETNNKTLETNDTEIQSDSEPGNISSHNPNDSTEPGTSQSSPPRSPNSDFFNDQLEDLIADMSGPKEKVSKQSKKEDPLDISKEISQFLDVPILDMNNIKCNSDFETAVIAGMMQLKINMDEIRSAQEELKATAIHTTQRLDDITNFLIDKKITNSNTEVSFDKKYNLKLPLETMDEFLEFDEKLQSNTFLRSDIYKELLASMDKN
ncbi:uncharacterized protein LOC103316575 isoform X1 [Nasonia vitripennis]|uniref:Uncharacterized protein n=1 Tax=Nasonia vitripennis TaxID=7425 RepID=A0A7M7IUS7_NASVI|nr:uncharacterized protein LOC103316575 isoform X1 [Nasonia vitripennis]